MLKRISLITIIILLPFLMSSCLTRKASASKDTKVVKRVCADKRLNLAFDHHLRAKEFLSSFYKTRKESELFFAWYASEDSTHMAKSITNCFDRQNKHFYAVKNISKKNRVLKGLIVQNMRLDSQARVSELFLDEYQKIFVRDIQ